MTAHDPLVAPHIEQMTPYVPGKPLEQLERELGIRDAIKLASNESPFGPSPRALAAAASALGQAHRYPDQHRLRAALADHHGVDLAQIVLGNGSNELIDLIARTFGQPGEHAVYPDPSFVCYRSATLQTAMAHGVVPLREHVHYELDAFLAQIRPDTRLVYVANPNNPTGTYLSRQALRSLLDALSPRTIAVIDEAYVEFADAPDFESALYLEHPHPRLVVLRTFSKAYGLAALRVGYGVAPREIVDYLDRVRAPFNVSALALAAAEAALGDQGHVGHYVLHNRRERARVTEALSQLGAQVAPSQTNFLLCRFAMGGRELAEALLQRGVIVRAMPPPITEWVRITIGSEAENDRLIDTVRALVPVVQPMAVQTW